MFKSNAFFKAWPLLKELELRSATLDAHVIYHPNLAHFLNSSGPAFQKLEFMLMDSFLVYSFTKTTQGWVQKTFNVTE